MRGVKAIKLFQHQDDRRSRWLSLLVDEINADLRTQKWALCFRTCNGLLFGLSSIVILWLGVLAPTDGEVLIDGVRTQGAGAACLRRMAGTVLQDDVLFAGSLAENISFFDPQYDAERAAQCAQIAAIHDDIRAMPMGYNTLVGDMGTVLSGGQKQRVLLARALYKRPAILFLDEATSHLDIDRERAVNAAIARLEMTRLIVAHRPDTIGAAAREIVLADGKIVRDTGQRACAGAEFAPA